MKSHNPMIFVPIFAAAAALVYSFLVSPGLKRLKAADQRLLEKRAEFEAQSAVLKTAGSLDGKMKLAEAELAELEKLELEPDRLGSYEMRARLIVHELAVGAGLGDIKYLDRPARPLPVVPGRPVPAALHSRRPIAISCSGDFAAIVSFIMRVEHELKHVAVQAVKITHESPDPEIQQAEIVLEWPVKGEERK